MKLDEMSPKDRAVVETADDCIVKAFNLIEDFHSNVEGMLFAVVRQDEEHITSAAKEISIKEFEEMFKSEKE